jgi:site-specific DNA-methyltransferase (adenine-specific)
MTHPHHKTDDGSAAQKSASASDLPPTGRIIPGDCLAGMAALPAGCVDLIFADPPYNIGYQYDHYEDTREDEDYVQWTCQWIDGCVRLLKPSGSFYILIGDEYAAQTRLHLKSLEKEKKIVFRNWIIWHYTFGQNCKAKFNRSHAHLFYVVGSAAHGNFKVNDLPFTFNRTAVAVPSARQTTYADLRAKPGGKLPDDTWYLRPQETQGDYFRPDEDTWYVSRLCGTFKERQGWHPCQLPEALLERIVKLSSNPGQVVFDPFTGSGTTLAVAARLERQWLGCELSEDYAQRALQRIEHAASTGTTHTTTMEDKGIVRGRPKKKAEPKRSADLFGRK